MRRVLKKVLFILLFLVICFLLVAFNNINVKASPIQETDVAIIENRDYSYVSFENVEGFKNFLLHENIDIYNLDDVIYLAYNFNCLYFRALDSGYIQEIGNDVLLYDGSFDDILYLESENDELNSSSRWNAGKTLEEANNGTHQVITRDAINSINSMFPNFFNKDNNEYITQLYSDYPDMYEDDYFNSWHFYNYNTKSNYWDGIFDDVTAKSKFFEHYNNAIAYYNTNRTQSFRELGCAIHYLCDIATPVHTGDGIENSDWWVGVLSVLAPGIVAGIYLGTMVSNHISFESYVDARDEYTECNIPSNINFDYYINTSLDTIIEDLAQYSYSYYDEATGNDANKYIAMVNTIPKAKEVTAGILYRFAKQFYNTSPYEGIMFRNAASNLYLTAADSNYANESNVLIDSISFNKKQIFGYDNYIYSNSLRTCNVFYPTDNSLKTIDVSGASTNNGANIQIYDRNGTDAQHFSINSIKNSSSMSYTGLYTINTRVTDYEKVISCQNDVTTIGTNLWQWEYSNTQSKQWFIDAYKSVSVDWESSNTQSNYVLKGQRIYYKLIITTSGTYTIQTYSNSDPYLELYNNSMCMLASNDDGGEANNSRIVCSLNTGVYYLCLKMYSTTQEGRVNTVIARTNDIPQAANGTTNQQLSLSTYDVRYYKLSHDLISNDYNIYTTGNNDTYIAIYDKYFNYIGSNDDGGQNYNAWYSYTFNNNDPIFISVRMYHGTDSGSINFIIEHSHVHNYIYTWVSSTQHSKSCSCGIMELQAHAVSPNAFNNGQQYAICLLCGGLASIGIVYHENVSSFPSSENGSFILPNGVIVLENIDFEAFLNGTLVFYYPNIDSRNISEIPPYLFKKKEEYLI